MPCPLDALPLHTSCPANPRCFVSGHYSSFAEVAAQCVLTAVSPIFEICENNHRGISQTANLELCRRAAPRGAVSPCRHAPSPLGPTSRRRPPGCYWLPHRAAPYRGVSRRRRGFKYISELLGVSRGAGLSVSLGRWLAGWGRRELGARRSMADGGGWQVSVLGAGDLGDPVGPWDRLQRGLSREHSGWGGAAAPGSGAPLAAAAAPLRSLPRRVEAVPQRRALPAPLLRPRRAAGVRAMAPRPGQLPRVGGAPERRGPGAPGTPGVGAVGAVGGAEPPGRAARASECTGHPGSRPGSQDFGEHCLPLFVLFLLSINTKN